MITSRSANYFLKAIATLNRTARQPKAKLRLLRFNVAESTVAKYRIKVTKPLPQTWKTFLRNHANQIVAIDFFTVPTTTSGLINSPPEVGGLHHRY